MQIDRDKIQLRADERLAAAGVWSAHEEQAEVFRRFLKTETERLRIRHRFGLGGLEIASGRSYLVDLVICRACQLAAADLGPAASSDLDSCSVIALGGYGRRELAPSSDVDVLFLHGSGARATRVFAERVLYLLWDMGLTVGHSFRSVSECVAIALEDLHSRNAMSEARLVAGSDETFRRFARALDTKVFGNKRRLRGYVEALRGEVERRYERFGSAVCLQEPNVKEGAGGLRDLHAMLWIGRAKYGSHNLDELRQRDAVTGHEYAAIRRSYDFLWRVRNDSHFVAARAADLLTLDIQPQLAKDLGYEPKRGLQPSELLMRDYYRRASELHRVSRAFVERECEKPGETGRFRFFAPATRDLGVFESFGGTLRLREGRGALRAQPTLILEAFAAAQSEGLSLDDELAREVRGALPVVGPKLRRSPEAARLFLEVLRSKGRVGPTLRRMHELEVLGRYLPEFGRVTFLVQHDLYHRYTIDEHTLRAIEALDGLQAAACSPLSRFARIFAELRDPALLYLGVFLHDIGKGRGGGHVAKGVRIAERVCARLGLDAQSADDVVFLVRQHLLLSHTSQRRNLAEEGLIDALASEIKTPDRLDMLTILTYADTSAVGPGVWNDWKEALLWDLYGRLRARLSTGAVEQAGNGLKDRVLRRLPESIRASAAERHFAMMPERVLRGADADLVVRQVALVRRLDDVAIATDWRSTAGKPYSELLVCARDRSGLLATIAGALTAHGVNILAVDVATREDDIAVDTFIVCEAGRHAPVRADRAAMIGASLESAAAGTYDVEAAVAAWRAKAASTILRPRSRRSAARMGTSVRFDAETSAEHTVVEVRAEDEPGLVYTIASTLASLGLDISFAKIATEKSHALDVFYVTDGHGKKLSPSQATAVERAIAAALVGVQGSQSTTFRAAPGRST
jgi:[protein-PII] uridylyltransferase